ncbi:hypothetical protein ZWY2020_040361 [Hordeum vulgare]|nr:hypothetical protein ZWY2020_040361 [Hordeum vulgare]
METIGWLHLSPSSWLYLELALSAAGSASSCPLRRAPAGSTLPRSTRRAPANSAALRAPVPLTPPSRKRMPTLAPSLPARCTVPRLAPPLLTCPHHSSRPSHKRTLALAPPPRAPVSVLPAPPPRSSI